MPAPRRVLIIGLDAATFDLILPWVDAGKLPNLATVLARGSAGPLKSTVPPMTFPAWTTLMTGKNPGKHGVFDFTEREPGGYGLRFVNANWVKAKTVWRILSDAGRRVAVMSLPVTYPPEPVNGLMISGFDAPGMAKGKADARSMYPQSLHQELQEQVGGYLISTDTAALMSSPDRALRAVLATMDQKIKCAKYLYAKEPWDAFMIVLGETDAIAHHFWKYHDPRSPFRDGPCPDEFRDAILTVYQRADAFLGDMLATLREGTAVMLVSDHGTGGYSDTAVYLNRWLQQEGFLRLRSATADSTTMGALGARAGKLMATVLGGAKRLGLRTVPVGVKAWLMRSQPAIVGKVESYLRFSAIDWDRTTAFADENPHYPQIWLNVRGRDPKGTVEPGVEYERLRETIARRLTAWRDPETGEPVVREVSRREATYAGAYVDRAPDLLIEWNLRGGYSYMPRLSQARETVPVRRLRADERRTAMSGSHREHGILAVMGDGIRPHVKIEGAEITDIAPTMLYLLGLPVPEDMDGKVLEAAIAEDLLRSRPVAVSGSSGIDGSRSEEGYSGEEAAVIEERLKGLGYIE